MTIGVVPRIGVLVLATTSFYAYVGSMVPQSEVQPPPTSIEIPADLTTAQMVTVGREIMDTKGLCFTCHTIGRTGALRFPDLSGVAVRATSRIPGLSDIEYFAQSMYEPDSYIVEGFNPGMPTINRPPIGLTDQEILTVIAYLQSLGGTPTVTLQTSHRFYKAPPAPGGEAPPAGGPPGDTAAPGEQLPLTTAPVQQPPLGAPPAVPAAPAPAPATGVPR